jgi:hypothetical protein
LLAAWINYKRQFAQENEAKFKKLMKAGGVRTKVSAELQDKFKAKSPTSIYKALRSPKK